MKGSDPVSIGNIHAANRAQVPHVWELALKKEGDLRDRARHCVSIEAGSFYPRPWFQSAPPNNYGGRFSR
jgi:hypothetical protein